MNFLDSDLFLDSFRDVAMATDFEQNLRNDLYSTTIFATFCAILVKIGPLTPKITQGVSVPFGTKRQKSIYHTKYLSKYWT